MVMGHAPVILPAVMRVKRLFGPWFYLLLAALHGSLLLRVVGGIFQPCLRTIGAELNAGALLGVHLISVQKVTVRACPESEHWRGVC
jgi:hypothetical protein